MSLFATNRRTHKKFPRKKMTKKQRKSNSPLKEESPMENEGVF